MNFTKDAVVHRPRLMAHGDLVIVYERHDCLSHIYLAKGTVYNNKFGVFHHDDIIGKPFGSKVFSKCSPGYLYLLEPTPELWSTALYTRTQIVNEMDAAIVTLKLDIHPGCVVVESGTGSGCMTLSLARAVYPSGHVHTFEYNGVRAEAARAEFQKLGVGEIITVRHKDVCGKYEPGGVGGFEGVPDHCADAVFLDLPEPWLALQHAERVLKPGANICCYSPCIEQVMKTCEKLRELKFHTIKMMEIRQRPYDGRVIEMEKLDLGVKQSSESSKSTDNNEVINEEMVIDSKESVVSVETGNKRKLESVEDTGTDDNQDEDVEESGGVVYSEGEPLTEEKQKTRDYYRELNRPKATFSGTQRVRVARPVGTMKGHTAFLTFAYAPLH